MENTTTQTNSITINGKISSDFQISHQVYGEVFYSFYLENERLSHACDTLPVIISERLLVNECFNIGDEVSINGQIRSYNCPDGSKTHLILSIFVKNICCCEESNAINTVFLNGFICKPPVYRTTPFGREIADILIAVNRAYGKSDYIPAICWGRNAKFAAGLPIGTNIAIHGRMQSREYQKKLNDEEIIKKIAYEVSVSRIETPE